MMYGPGWGYGYSMMGGSWIGPLMMLLFGLLVVLGVVLLVMWAVRMSSGRGHPGHGGAAPGPSDEAVAIAKRRLASGEITRDQYDEIMRALGS